MSLSSRVGSIPSRIWGCYTKWHRFITKLNYINIYWVEQTCEDSSGLRPNSTPSPSILLKQVDGRYVQANGWVRQVECEGLPNKLARENEREETLRTKSCLRKVILPWVDLAMFGCFFK